MNLKRTLACLFILAAFPLLTSSSQNNSIPFATVAFAGHSSVGDYACTCGCSQCICDPGETPMNCNRINKPTLSKSDGSFDQGASPVGTGRSDNFDFGSSAMMMTLALLVWARFLRA